MKTQPQNGDVRYETCRLLKVPLLPNGDGDMNKATYGYNYFPTARRARAYAKLMAPKTEALQLVQIRKQVFEDRGPGHWEYDDGFGVEEVTP